jgi:5-methylcytosine-specific restriction protein A
MPTSPPTACHCGGKRTNGVCDKCGPKKRATDTRQHAAARGYDYQWQRFRDNYLRFNPLCVDCRAIGVVTAARDIHHIQKLSSHPDLKYDDGNLMPLCKMHHDKRTARGE